jgi:hypothetical protein
MTTRIGDRPLFSLSNQRFDKGDAYNIARYYEEIITRFVGSIYGQAWGCLSNPQFDIVTVNLGGGNTERRLVMSKCVLLHSVPPDGAPLNPTGQDYGPWDATITLYDPARDGQPAQALSLPAYSSTRRRPWILFRRQETPTGLGNKAYWNTATNTEDIGATLLRQSEYVEFKFSLTYSEVERAAGWYRMAYIDGWSGSPASPGPDDTPTVVPIHWMDSQYYNDATPPVAGVAVGTALAFPGRTSGYNVKGFNPTTQMPELAKLLHYVVGKLNQHYSTASVQEVNGGTEATYGLKSGAFVVDYTNTTTGWLSTPARGLLELHNNLTTAENSLANLFVSVDLFRSNYMRTTRLLHTLYVTPVGDEADPWVTFSFNVVVCSNTNISNSFSPNIRVLTTPGPALGADDLTYQFTPQDVTGRKTFLDLSIGINFVIDSVVITANDNPNISLVSREFISVTQNYMTGYGGVTTLPPARFIRVQFVIDSGTGAGSDEIRPFTVQIYGRNI